MTLIPRLTYGDLDLTAYPYGIEFNYDLGAGQVTYETVLSSLLDGESISANRVSNRELTIRVHIEGPTLAEIAEATAALVAECDKQVNTFSVDPGDDFAAVTVFDTFRAQMTPERDDDHELNGFRVFELTIPALPFARDDTLTVTPALTMPGTKTDATVYTGTSTAGWSAPNEAAWWSVTFSATGGVVTAVRTVADPAQVGIVHRGILLRLDVPVSTETKPYVTFRYRVAPGTKVAYWVGNTRLPVVSTFLDVDGWTEVTVKSTGWTALGIVIDAYQYGLESTLYRLEDITASTHPPVRATPRQMMRTVEVGGSARTEGNIHIDASAGTVADCMVYTWPLEMGEYMPTLSAYVSGGTDQFADPFAASGFYRDISAGASWLVPGNLLPPGDYTLVGRFKTNAPGAGFRRVNLAVRSWMGATTIGNPIARTVAPWMIGGSAYGMATLGKYTLPPTRIGSGGAVEIVIARSPDEATAIYVDELYALHEDGALTMLSPYTGKHVWIESPSLAEPRGAIWVGESADGSDKWFASWLQQSWQHHEFSPAGINMLTVTGGCNYAAVNVSHYRRHHTHATTREG